MIDNYLLYNTWPSIDLHGYDRDSAYLAVNDFLKESILLKHKYITIVHGKGLGIVKDAVTRALKSNKSVKTYKSSYFNEGMTVVELNIDTK